MTLGDIRHDHTWPGTRQYNLLAPETGATSDWQRSKLLPHPPHSYRERGGSQRPMRGRDACSDQSESLEKQQETIGPWPSYPAVITSSIHNGSRPQATPGATHRSNDPSLAQLLNRIVESQDDDEIQPKP